MAYYFQFINRNSNQRPSGSHVLKQSGRCRDEFSYAHSRPERIGDHLPPEDQFSGSIGQFFSGKIAWWTAI